MNIPTRRQLLQGLGAGGLLGVAGCSGQEESTSTANSGNTPDTEAPGTQARTGTDIGTTETARSTLSSPSTVKGTWPIYYEGNPNGSNHVSMSGPNGKLETVWSRKLGASDLTLGSGYIFAAKNSGVRAIDAATGEIAWENSNGGSNFAGGTVYYSGGTDIPIIDAETGDQLWKTDGFLPGWTDGDSIYGIPQGSSGYLGQPLQRRAAQTGKILWEFKNPTEPKSISPELVDTDANIVIARQQDEAGKPKPTLYGIDRSNGTQQWTMEPSLETPYPLTDGKRVYGVSKNIVAYSYGTSTPDWTREPKDPVDPHLAAVNSDRLFILDSRNKLLALDTSSGRIEWEQELSVSNRIYSRLFLADKTLYISLGIREDGTETATASSTSRSSSSSYSYKTLQIARDGTTKRVIDGIFTMLVSERLLFGFTSSSGNRPTLHAYASTT